MIDWPHNVRQGELQLAMLLHQFCISVDCRQQGKAQPR